MNNNQNNGGRNSSLSPSLRERQIESQGENLAKARERSYTPPPLPEQNKGKSAAASLPKKDGIPGQQSIGSKEGLGNNGGLPPREGIGNKNAPTNAAGSHAPQDRAQGLKNKVASAGLQSMGVPKGISDKIASSKLGKKSMLGMMNPAMGTLSGLKNVADNAGKSEMDKTAADKEAEEQAKEKESGGITLRLPLVAKLIIFLGILPSFCFVIFFMAFVVSYIADKNAFEIFVGNIVGNQEAREYTKFKEEMGMGSEELAVGMGTGNLTYNEFLSRRENLGNIYEQFDCETPEECLERDEVKFYVKVNDISYRYKQKYGVKIEWELLMATAIGLNLDSKDMFKKLFNEYNYDDVENLDTLMNLDWDYDYKKISGYEYLSSSNYQYDLQILAKNMVTKTTTQTCSKTVRNADGTTSVVITKTKTDTDVEDMYLQPGQPYYLKCDVGETYNISSNYSLDLDKYDEFLLEFLEHKLYLPDNGAGVTDPGMIDGDVDLTPSAEEGEYIYPLPLPLRINSRYGSRILNGKPDFHGGVDLYAPAGTSVYAVASGGVIAAKGGCPPLTTSSSCNGGAGNYIMIQHDNGVCSTYMHASSFVVKEGDRVEQGQVIMLSGNSGNSYGAHLHLGFKPSRSAGYVNPNNYYKFY